MTDQESQLSVQTRAGLVPVKWQERFLIKRIEAEDIEISEVEWRMILKLMSEGQKYIQLGKYTIMLSGIRSIEPKYPPNNVPPRPKDREDYKREVNCLLTI